jgi:ParB family transcriptional regulator, chromosome partitioning protein
MSKITLTAAQAVPLNQLVPSSANVRRVKAGVSIEDLAEDIARRRLLQSLTVRPVLDESGAETGQYAVIAGGRRLAALKLLAKQKRLAKTTPVPCIIKADGAAEEDSLAENTMREALHPLDQFRAFQALREEHGMGDEEIAAKFFVTPAVVRQRLKLAAASPKLLDLYAADAMSLEQLMAFCVTGDHARQEQVWEALQRGLNRDPYYIRRLLTEGAARASDKRAVLVGLEAYEAAGGMVERDLFQEDHGGWLRDIPLLERLVREKLERAADEVRAEGWLWVEAALGFPYGHTFGLRRLAWTSEPLSEKEQAERDTLQAEYDAIEAEHAGSAELPDDVDQRLAEIEQALARLDERPRAYDPEELARAGAFVSIDYDGSLKVERGFVRLADEAPVSSEARDGVAEEGELGRDGQVAQATTAVGGGVRAGEADDDEHDGGGARLSDRLMTELTAQRTLALREALAGDPETAFLAVLHALAVKVFYGSYTVESCLEIEAKSSSLKTLGGLGLSDTPAARACAKQHETWAQQLPRQTGGLWEFLVGLDRDSRASLFAYCAATTLNAVYLPYDRRPRALAHADRLAAMTSLDMSCQWAPTVDNYLGRVTKARILEAVREARGEQAAQLIDHLKKGDMAQEAERLLVGTNWLPEPLRTPGLEGQLALAAPDPESDELPAFLTDGDAPGAEPAYAVAAE